MPPPNEQAYKTKIGNGNFAKHPTSLHLYYIIFRAQDDYDARHFFYDQYTKIEPNEINQIISQLTQNADKQGQPTPPHANLKNIIWRRKSHLVFVVKNASHEIASHIPGSRVGIEFKNLDTQEEINPAFFDAKMVDASALRDKNGAMDTTLSGVRCINHMKKKEQGSDLDEEAEKYTFVIYLKLRGQPIRDEDPTITSAGTNLGPPVPPPA